MNSAHVSLTSTGRIGIFGGSFDPIHLGHLLLAEQAREQLELDTLVFLPAAISPLKLESSPRASAKQRIEMVQLAIGGNAHFAIDGREIDRGGTSFTVDTLQEIRGEKPEAELFFLMGVDSLDSFDQWRDPSRICRLAHVVVMARGGYTEPDMGKLLPYMPDATSASLEKYKLRMPEVEISSSDIRRRFQNQRSTRYQLHPAVEAYIKNNGLYQLNTKVAT